MKKKSKKKIQRPEDVLKRAEKLFKKKSFQAAQREYEKFKKLNKNKVRISEEVVEHMAVCRRETAVIRAGELAKKARRLLKKGQQHQAIQIFEQAFKLTGDRKLLETISKLRADSADKDFIDSVNQAEAAGNFSKAAEMLGRRLETCADKSLLCRRARCLVKSGQWQQAAAVYADGHCTETADLYAHGFALAKEGRFFDCLTVWQRIQSEHPAFTRQKEAVVSLFLQEAEAELEKEPLQNADDIISRVQSLALHGDFSSAAELLNRCHLLKLAKLWQGNRIDEIVKRDVITKPLNITVLAIQARAAFLHVEAGGSKLAVGTIRKFIDLWLSSLFVSGTETVREPLVKAGLELVKKYVGYHPDSGGQLLRQWEKNVKLLSILDKLRATGKIDKSILLLTPALALRTGTCRDILLLIVENKEAFSDEQFFLNAAAWYSKGAAALLMAENHDYEGAFTYLDKLDKDKNDPFVAHAVTMVRVACGLNALSCQDFKKAQTLLATAVESLDGSEWLLEQLVAELDIEEDWDAERLNVCADILTLLQKKYPSDNVAAALCRVMTRRAVELFNTGKMNIRVLVKTLVTASALNPDDEITKYHLDGAKCNLEIAELNKYIDRFKLSAAGRLAADTQYSEVREIFFNMIGQICDEAEQESFSRADAGMVLVQKFLKHAKSVDPLHPVTLRLETIAEKNR